MKKFLPKLADNETELVVEDQTVIPSEQPQENGDHLVPLVVINDDATEEPVEQMLKDEEEQPCQPCHNVQDEEKVEEIIKIEEEIMDSNLPPPPPKRSSNTNQRLKRLSKMIKYSIPSKKATNGKVERKSLKEKVMDNDLTTYLKERRAVSESRFKTIDNARRTPSPQVLISRTRSDPDLSPEEEKKVTKEDFGIQPGNINSLVEKFERQSSPAPRDLLSPTRELRSPTVLREIEKSKSPSPLRNTVKPFTPPPAVDSGTSPESEMDPNKSETESRKGKKAKKDKKERRRHSGCEACSASDREHKEHKKAKKAKKSKKVTINSDNEARKSKSKSRPPLPKSEDLGPKKDGFFKQLLINESQPEIKIQRTGRQPTKVNLTRPAFNTFLKEKKAVSESRFRRDSISPIERGSAKCPKGSLQGEMYFENRSKFENGNRPVATFPRSLSNLERRSTSAMQESILDRPNSSLSNKDSRHSGLFCPFPEHAIFVAVLLGMNIF